MSKIHYVIAVIVALTITTGCGPIHTRHPVPADLANSALVPGMPYVRTWGDYVDEHYKQSLIDSARQELAYYQAHPEVEPAKSLDMLLLSGGGENGAFGAGLLNGWTAAGDRPTFKLVTGISTGALIAPFAFLGPEYDDALRRFYTETTAKDILKRKSIFAMLRDDSLVKTDPLAQVLDREITPEVLKLIAVEHAKGRRLLIATTNLEAQRPVIWDMGAIAAIGTPEAEKLFQTVMLASASIPGAFPPQYIEVEAGGQRYDEMHVDGGTITQVFLWGGGFTREQARAELKGETLRPARMFIVRNGKFHPERQELRALFVDIAGRSVSTLVKTQGIGDMFRLYVRAQNEGAEFNLAYIPETFTAELKEPFDTEYMNALYQFGYDQARNGYPWRHTPPLVDDPQAPVE